MTQTANAKLRQRGIPPFRVILAIILAAVVIWSVYPKPNRQHSVRVPGAEQGQEPDSEYFADLILARSTAGKGDYEAALEHVDRVIAIQPESIPANLLKAELLFRLYRADEMCSVLDNVLRQEPGHFEAHANMAFAQRFAGDLDAAEEHAEWCLKQQPGFLPVLRIRAEIFRDRGEADRALQEIREVLKAQPADIPSRILEAELLVYRREFEAAYQALAPLSPVASQNHQFTALMAQICQLLGRDAEATEYRSLLDRKKSVNSGR